MISAAAKRIDGARGALGASVTVALLGALLLLGVGPFPAASQEEVPAAGPPLSLSQRLTAQGHTVAPDEAAYLDADEQVTEDFVRLLAYVQMMMTVPPSTEGWRESLGNFLEAMVVLDPERTPVPPPESLAEVHADAVAYRAHLSSAALEWLHGVEASDPAWMQRGMDEYGAAEQARLAWYKALYERYTGEPAPGP